ncbi:zinc cadmium resistance [Fusarium albosuccineum]|uniref:Zinc cadmium resistance n=1 Tax=Fusarium albosuccineum TaxID=1237068 RepID=A0A8H4PEK4_9HYPO|nr:zinc cadmium resistance [Fusarium albosuccineum]
MAVGFYTHSLALIADAFHYLSDLIGIVVALIALVVQERTEPAPQKYTFGWQRATLLGAFFNGVFLLALGVSILVQAVERFVDLTPVDDPHLVLIVGSIGLALNLLVMSFLHEHDHKHGGQGHGHEEQHCPPTRGHRGVAETPANDAASEFEARLASVSSSHHEHKHTVVALGPPGRDLGMMGVFIHVLGDAINNIGVIIAAVIIWKAEGEGRYYADPAVGVFIAIMILLSAIPLVKNSGDILLQIAPGGIRLEDVKHDIEKIPGIESVHELHIWRLDQRKSIASAHIVVDGRTVKNFGDKAKIIMECLHAYGIHSATLQPEVLASPPVIMADSATPDSQAAVIDTSPSALRRRQPRGQDACQLICGTLCDGMRCCAPVQLQ